MPLVTLASSSIPTATARPQSRSTQRASDVAPVAVTRRDLASSFLLGLAAAATTSAAAATLSFPRPALARDAKAAAAAAAARKEALRRAAEASRSGVDKSDSAFPDSEYSVAEDHTTPNSHSHQSEGARTSGGD